MHMNVWFAKIRTESDLHQAAVGGASEVETNMRKSEGVDITSA